MINKYEFAHIIYVLSIINVLIELIKILFKF